MGNPAAFLAPAPAAEIRPSRAPSFSIIIPAYQAAGTIAEAVGSVLSQTAPPREVIVCDDGSTDGTADELTPFRSRIEYLRKENGGGASALNAALQAASSEYAVVLDADDTYLPARLEALGRLLAARPDLDIVTTDAYVEIGGRVVRRAYHHDWRFATDGQRIAILRSNFVFTHAAVRRSKVHDVGGWDESFRVTYDWDLWVRLILSGSQVGLVPEPLSRYRLQRTSLSAARVSLARECVAVLEKWDGSAQLSEAEQEALSASMGFYHRRRQLLELKAALRSGDNARGRALAVAFGGGFPARTRAKAIAAALAPGVVAHRLAALPREMPGGILVPANDVDDTL